jgi:hypothetical protein
MKSRSWGRASAAHRCPALNHDHPVRRSAAAPRVPGIRVWGPLRAGDPAFLHEVLGVETLLPGRRTTGWATADQERIVATRGLGHCKQHGAAAQMGTLERGGLRMYICITGRRESRRVDCGSGADRGRGQPRAASGSTLLPRRLGRLERGGAKRGGAERSGARLCACVLFVRLLRRKFWPHRFWEAAIWGHPKFGRSPA